MLSSFSALAPPTVWWQPSQCKHNCTKKNFAEVGQNKHTRSRDLYFDIKLIFLEKWKC